MRRWLVAGGVVLVVLATALYVGSCGTRQPIGPDSGDAGAGQDAPAEQTTATAPATEDEAGDAAPTDAKTPDASTVDPLAPGTLDRTADTAALLAAMRDARDCYQASDCKVDAEGPRDPYYRAGQVVAEGLAELRARHRAGALGDDDLAAAAREFMAFDNPHARAEALAALGQVPPDPRNLDRILEALDGHYAARLFEPALEEFQRYASDAARQRIEAFLASNLRTGAHRSAEAIARNLGSFLRPDNVDDFRAIAEALPDDSRRARLIRDALDEYRRRRSGD